MTQNCTTKCEQSPALLEQIVEILVGSQKGTVAILLRRIVVLGVRAGASRVFRDFGLVQSEDSCPGFDRSEAWS